MEISVDRRIGTHVIFVLTHQPRSNAHQSAPHLDSALRVVTSSRFRFDLRYRTNINFYMCRKIKLNQCLKINIFVATKLARIHADNRHETRHEAQEAVRENMEV